MGKALTQLFKNSRGPNEPDPVNREALEKMFPGWPGNVPFFKSVMRGSRYAYNTHDDAIGYECVNECSGEIRCK